MSSTRYSTNDHVFADPEQGAFKDTPVKKCCDRRALKICAMLFGVTALSVATAAVTVVIMYPHLEMDDDEEVHTPTPFDKFVDAYGKRIRNFNPLVEGGNRSLPDTGAKKAGSPGASADDDLDFVTLEHEVDDDGNEADVETRTHFDQAAREYLRNHIDLLENGSTDGEAADPSGNVTEGHGRMLGDSRRHVGWKPGGGHKTVVRLTPRGNVFQSGGCSGSGYGCGGCTGTLVSNDVVLTAAHCIYERNWIWNDIEVAPTEGGSFGGTEWPWMKHTNCAHAPQIRYPCGVNTCTKKAYYPCGVRHCRRCWGPSWARKCGSYPCGTNTCSRDVTYPCGVKWCTRKGPEPHKCTWRYQARYMTLPSPWMQTNVGKHGTDGQTAWDNKWDIGLIKLHPTQGRHAGARAGYKWPKAQVSAKEIQDMQLELTGYPKDKGFAMVTAVGRTTGVEEDSAYSRSGYWQDKPMLVKHTISSNGGQSGSGLYSGNNVYAVHIAQAGGINNGEARVIDNWWHGVMRNHGSV